MEQRKSHQQKQEANVEVCSSYGRLRLDYYVNSHVKTAKFKALICKNLTCLKSLHFALLGLFLRTV